MHFVSFHPYVCVCGVSGDKEGIFSESREQNNDLLTMSCRKELMKLSI